MSRRELVKKAVSRSHFSGVLAGVGGAHIGMAVARLADDASGFVPPLVLGLAFLAWALIRFGLDVDAEIQARKADA